MGNDPSVIKKGIKGVKLKGSQVYHFPRTKRDWLKKKREKGKLEGAGVSKDKKIGRG